MHRARTALSVRYVFEPFDDLSLELPDWPLPMPAAPVDGLPEPLYIVPLPLLLPEACWVPAVPEAECCDVPDPGCICWLLPAPDCRCCPELPPP